MRSFKDKVLFNHFIFGFSPAIMFTLTLKPGVYEEWLKHPYNHFRKFMNRLRYICKKEGIPKFDYINRLEAGAHEGRWHYHLLVDRFIPIDLVYRAWAKDDPSARKTVCGSGIDAAQGYIDVRSIPPDKGWAYLSKYCAKGANEDSDYVELQLGLPDRVRRYTTSRGVRQLPKRLKLIRDIREQLIFNKDGLVKKFYYYHNVQTALKNAIPLPGGLDMQVHVNWCFEQTSSEAEDSDPINLDFEEDLNRARFTRRHQSLITLEKRKFKRERRAKHFWDRLTKRCKEWVDHYSFLPSADRYYYTGLQLIEEFGYVDPAKLSLNSLVYFSMIEVGARNGARKAGTKPQPPTLPEMMNLCPDTRKKPKPGLGGMQSPAAMMPQSPSSGSPEPPLPNVSNSLRDTTRISIRIPSQTPPRYRPSARLRMQRWNSLSDSAKAQSVAMAAKKIRNKSKSPPES